MYRLLCACCALAVPWGALGAAPASFAVTYQITKVADTTTAGPSGMLSFDTFSDAPSISGRTVAFVARYMGGAGVFTGNGGPTTTIADATSPAPFMSFLRFKGPVIRGNSIAFIGEYGRDGDTGSGVFVGDGGPLTTIVKSGDKAPLGTFVSFASPSIDAGQVAFRGVFRNPASTTRDGIFVGGGDLQLIAQGIDPDTAPPAGFFHVGTPAIAGGDVLFGGTHVVYEEVPMIIDGIYTSDGDGFTAIVNTGSPAPTGTFNTFSSWAIAGSTVAFAGEDGGGPGIFVWDGGNLRTVLRTDEPLPIGVLQYIRQVATDGSTIAVYGDVEADGPAPSEQGIFTVQEGHFSRVVQEGDPLFGSEVLFLNFDRFGFDSLGSGNIAFSYWLTDGRQGVAMASPVPEPISVHLFVAGIVALANSRWRNGPKSMGSR